MRIIHQSENNAWRIVEHADQDMTFEDHEGDMFNASVNSDIPIEVLARERREEIELCNREGFYGYVLERWNPEPGCGWEQVAACWGFVGQYEETEASRFHHYIVDELKAQIQDTAI